MAAPQLLRAKIVMVGSPGVGKTSLVRRFVHSLFSDEYHSTLGVKVDRKSVQIGDTTVTMLLWDMHGEMEGLDVPTSYLRGATAALAVFDASRPLTLSKAAELRNRLLESSPNAIAHVVANKSDLDVDWPKIEELSKEHGVDDITRMSAKLDEGVEEKFAEIASQIANSNG